MPENESPRGWDRFDVVTKRWQTVLAGIVALGTIVTAVVAFMGWRWPESWFNDPQSSTSASPLPPPGVALARVRYLDKAWQDKIEIDGTNPTFQVYAGYTNTSDESQRDVYARLIYDQRLIPIKGTTILRNVTNPNGLEITDHEALISTWMNVGNYAPNSNVLVYHLFTLRSADFPCGSTTLTLRTVIRETDLQDSSQDIYSAEAHVVYTKKCE